MVLAFLCVGCHILSLEVTQTALTENYGTYLLPITFISLVAVVLKSRGAGIDKVTGLAERSLLCKQMTRCLAEAKNNLGSYTFCLVNLDRFRSLNLALGHAQGDSLLRIYGQELRQYLPSKAIVGRLSGDEFGFFLPTAALRSYSDIQEIKNVDLERLLSKDIQLSDVSVLLSCSIGFTQFPLDEYDTAESVFRRADIALMLAKQSGGCCAIEFLQPMGLCAERRFTIEADLRAAIANDELTLFLQSQVDMTGKVVSAECLVRWCHPSRGLLLPGEFLEIAEESDLIVDLGTWVIEQACHLQVLLKEHGHEISLSVNVSPRQFFKPDFVDRVRRTIELTGANPRLLTFEVTESLVIKDVDVVLRKMKQLVDVGIKFSLDDFGTGYSSLSYLKVLPVHEIKIARSFITDAPHNSGDAALVKAMVSVAEDLSLQVVAEGVETVDQSSFLEGLGSMLLQGFLFSRPLPYDVWIERHADSNGRIPTHEFLC